MAIDERFASQALDFINQNIKQVLPEASIDAGSGINTILSRVTSNISAALFQEIEHVLTSRDLSNPDALSEADMDLLLGNLLTSRDQGDLAFGNVRLYYQDRIRREFSAGLIATTETRELNYLTLADLSYDPQDYLLDVDNGLYYINVPFAAEESGDEYNAEVGDIRFLLNDTSGAVSVTNAVAFRNGQASQSNSQALNLARRSISTRTPLSENGAIFWLQNKFGTNLRDLLVIGNGDPEMRRDEVYDMGEGETPRFQIGVDSLDPVTREQLGTAQDLHVGGRTDIYILMDAVNYVQQHVDIFADMTLDVEITNPGTVTSIQATIVTGTTGTVPATGKLIIDFGGSGEEVIYYGQRTTSDNNTFVFSNLASTPTNVQAQDAPIKVVNNSELTIASDGDITILPVFQIAEVRLLDPVTFEAIGDPIPETTPESRDPGWYLTKSNPYDLLSARETKTLVVDEKRGFLGNVAKSGVNGTTSTVTLGTTDYTKYTGLGVDFTGYQGREITLSGGASATRSILQVLSSSNEILISGDPVTESSGDVDFSIPSYHEEYVEHPIRLAYYTNTEIQEAQTLFDQDADRIVTGDTLARAFMPVFLDFTMNYRGDGEAIDIRANLNEVLKTSSGTAIGESLGSKFDYSDLINAAYVNDQASYVQTPFEVRVRRLQLDGTQTVRYMNPGPNTVNQLAVRIAPSVPSQFLEAKRPSTIDAFTVPSRGRLFLGGFGSNQETVDYDSVITDGDNHTFVLTAGQTIDLAHVVDEPLTVSVRDYDPDEVITDGVITDEREYRPFLGEVLIEQLED